MPPIPLPTYTPSRSGATALRMPLSETACPAAATAYWVNRSMRRASPFSMPKASGAKSLTSAATLLLKSDASKCVIGPTPFLPWHRLSQNVLISFPTGVIAPMPVITTRFTLNPSLHIQAAVDLEHRAGDIGSRARRGTPRFSAISSASPIRFSGTAFSALRERLFLHRGGHFGLDKAGRHRVDVIPLGASSRASVLVRPIMPALAAA